MYRRLLVPLDGSTAAEAILPYVRLLAPVCAARVELLLVEQPGRAASTVPSNEYLEATAASLSGCPHVECRVERGDPAARIIDVSAELAGTLVAMSAHGYSGAHRWLLGGVAEKVLRAGREPLLIVRAGEATGSVAHLETVVVPLDGSTAAEEALPVAARLADRLNLEVLLARVLLGIYFERVDDLLPFFGASAADRRTIRARAEAEIAEYLEQKTRRLRRQGLARVSRAVIAESTRGAAAEIIDLAEGTPHSLVAMTTRGRSAVGRWLLGSVTERVVRHSTRPVLVVRPRP
ncbi:MAG TPA: universal stress protein [candidate division Zixibacteria bacterium]|nr:universal stress protein [candidate division Zixibacteria bacterium]